MLKTRRSAHTWVLKRDETVAWWGYNSHGQLGNGTTTDSSFPVAVGDFQAAPDKLARSAVEMTTV